MLVALAADRLAGAARITPRALGNAIDWNGWIADRPAGLYTFSVPAGTRLAIDGRVIADGVTSTPIRLDASPHAFDFEDRRAPGPEVPQPPAARPDVMFSRDGSAPAPLPPSVLLARKPSTITRAIRSGLDAVVAATEWMWVAALLGAALAIGGAAWRVRRDSIAADVDWRWLRWILLGSLVLNAIPIWWGLPATWPPDELTPGTVLRAFATGFSHGWFDRWPPLHYYVLTVAFSPVMLLDALGRISYESAGWPALLTTVERAVSVAAAAGTLIAVALVATRVFGRRAGLFAAVIFALAIPFPYYAKTANLDVPYIFWFAVSLVFYFRLLETSAVREAVAFAAFATLAVCTKDQAYALYPLMGLVIAVNAWRARRFAPVVAGVATAAAIFAICHNFLLNWNGFLEHVRYIVGPGSENYQAFPRTLAGRLDLLALTGQLVKNSWGWPLTAVCGAGVAYAVFVRRCPPAAALLAPVVSYYVAFVNVVLYNYDRFVMPMTLVLAIFGGFAIDRFLAATGSGRWRQAAVGVVLAYSVLYAATIDALMLRDSRYVVARWAEGRARPDELFAVSGPRELEPTFDVPWIDVSTRADLARARPAYYVLSADYARAVPRDTEWGALIDALQSGRAGYGLVARVRCASPWPWLPGAHPDLVGPRPVRPGGSAVSVLRDINPTLEIFARDAHGPETVGCATGLLP